MLGFIGALLAIPVAGIVQVLVQEWWSWRRERRAAALTPPGVEPPEIEALATFRGYPPMPWTREAPSCSSCRPSAGGWPG